MAFRRGGLYGIKKAIECNNTSTAVLSSGVQLSGRFTEIIADSNEQPVYIKTEGNSNLSYNNNEIPGHSIDIYQGGFQAPVGKLSASNTPIENMTDSDLINLNIEPGKNTTLEFESGVIVKGVLVYITKEDNKIILMTFENCEVLYNNKKIYTTENTFVLPIGESIVSVFSGAADKDAFDQPSMVSKTRVMKNSFDEKGKHLNTLYQTVRDYRAEKINEPDFIEIWQHLKTSHTQDWLLALEILEMLAIEKKYQNLEDEIKSYLDNKVKSNPELAKLINDGIYLAYNPTKYRKTWKN
jgi:phenylalanine-4-hydroxylase